MFDEWSQRSKSYNNLIWVHDIPSIDLLIAKADLERHQRILDVGAGTGIIAKAIKNQVKEVVALDSSRAMLDQGDWSGISTIHWDIREPIFWPNTFDRIIARMSLHHITNGLDKALLRCYDLLKPGGKFIIVEGVPPNDTIEMVSWYHKMFKLKESRITFTTISLLTHLSRTGFYEESMGFFTISLNLNNWLDNSDLSEEISRKIYKIHIEAPNFVKEAYKMQIFDKNCIIDTRNIILVLTK